MEVRLELSDDDYRELKEAAIDGSRGPGRAASEESIAARMRREMWQRVWNQLRERTDV